MKTDPTDTGGMFVGRRPGTGPVRYRALPPPGSLASRRFDACLAALILLAMVIISLTFWGPVPLLALWVGSQIQYLTDSPGLGILCAFLLILGILLGALMVLKRMDRSWILVRRAAGHDQRDGILGAVFATTCAIGAVSFSIWLIFFSGAELAPVGIHF